MIFFSLWEIFTFTALYNAVFCIVAHLFRWFIHLPWIFHLSSVFVWHLIAPPTPLAFRPKISAQFYASTLLLLLIHLGPSRSAARLWHPSSGRTPGSHLAATSLQALQRGRFCCLSAALWAGRLCKMVGQTLYSKIYTFWLKTKQHITLLSYSFFPNITYTF